jgi:hypothetical protein
LHLTVTPNSWPTLRAGFELFGSLRHWPVNRELVWLYWQIGRDILDRQQRESW